MSCLARLQLPLAIALTLSVSLAVASTHSNNSGHRASSYAPRTHSTTHVYGSPISRAHLPRQTTIHRVRAASSHRAIGVARDSHGRIRRSAKARDSFRHSHPCPSTGRTGGACPGYVIDHVQALKHGGADAPSNMQWQTKEAAKAKDKVE